MVDGVLQAKVSTPPIDGKANKALCRLVAKQAGVASSQVSVLRGEKARQKLLLIKGLDEAELKARLVNPS